MININHAKRMFHNGIKVTPVSDSKLKDYDGMNRPAAKALGYKPIPKQGEVIIRKDLTGLERRRTIHHEAVEANLMSKGQPYWKAHLNALEAEKRVR